MPHKSATDWPPRIPGNSPLTLHPRGYQAFIAGRTRWVAGKVPYDKALAAYHRKAAALVAKVKPLAEPKSWAATARVTIHALLNRWLLDRREDADRDRLSPNAWSQYRRSAKRIDAVAGHWLAADWSPSQTEALHRQLADAHGEDFARRAVSHLATACRHAEEREWVDRPVRLGAKVVARLTCRPRAAMKWILYTPAQIRRILAAADAACQVKHGFSRKTAEQLRAMILLALNGGYGAKELSDLPKTAVDLDRAMLTSVRAKTGVSHVTPLWPETVEALRPVLAQRPGDSLLFRTREGKPWCRVEAIRKGGKIDRIGGADNFAYRWRHLVRQLGLKIDKQGPYKLRHLFATIADSAGDPHATSILMGHALPGSRGSYINVSEERLRAVVDHVRRKLLLEN